MTDTPFPEAVVFDWDNTLVDSWAVIHAANAFTFEAMGMTPWTLEETRQNVAKSMREAFPVLFGNRWEEARDVFYTRYEEIHLSYLKPLAGAETALKNLSEAGVPMAIVSNKTGSFLRKEVGVLGWADYFHPVLGAGDLERDKPDEMVIQAALGPIGLKPGRTVWFVGDNAIDMECAHRSGCTAVLMHEQPSPSNKHDAWPPHMNFTDFEGFITTITKL
ncbi:MAG: HAD family hydrolase [Rhodospirillales bacterium]